MIFFGLRSRSKAFIFVALLYSSMKNPLNTNRDPALRTGRLDVEEFVQARKHEIERLEAALSASSTKRTVYQKPPRKLRRRQASHNPKRMPKRLQKQAEAQFIRDQPKISRKKRKLDDESVPEEVPVDESTINELAPRPSVKRYAQRQKTKTWLPTHIWHRKRAKFVEKWGYLIPTAPTQKQYRLTHRIGDMAENASLVWDTSYFGTFIIHYQSFEPIGALLQKHFPGSNKPLFTQGSKAWQGKAYDDNDRCLGPCVAIFQPQRVVVNAHPAIYESLFQLWLQYLDKVKVEDCRFAIGSIDIMGSRALSNLANCLLTTEDTPVWKQVRALDSINCLPSQCYMNLEVEDPRMLFPPSKQRYVPGSSMLDWPEPGLNQLFVKEMRQKSYSTMSTQKQLNARKTPGRHIAPKPSDPKIPVCIVRIHDRVRVMLPWGWVKPLWQSVTYYANTYIGGIKQMEQLALEHNLPSFPKDWQFTPSGAEEAEAAFEKAKKDYLSRPSACRYSLHDDGDSAFRCQWELLDQTKLAPVSLKAVKRGTPKDCARIYNVEDLDKWLSHDSKRSQELPVGNLVGFVTSGSFNLNEAKGTGVGSALIQSGYCLVRNGGESDYFLAELSAITDTHL